MMNASWDEAVAWTRERLDEVFAAVALNETYASKFEMDLVEELDRLNELAASDTSWVEDAKVLRSLVTEELTRAWRAGLAVPGSTSGSAGPYVTHLRKVLSKAARERVAFDALRFHAAGLDDTNTPRCYELRTFVNDVLRDIRTRPAALGGPKVHRSRDALIHALVYDISERYSVTPTRNRETASPTSACDIVAEAMPNKARLPKSYAALERIWQEGERALKREISIRASGSF